MVTKILLIISVYSYSPRDSKKVSYEGLKCQYLDQDTFYIKTLFF